MLVRALFSLRDYQKLHLIKCKVCITLRLYYVNINKERAQDQPSLVNLCSCDRRLIGFSDSGHRDWQKYFSNHTHPHFPSTQRFLPLSNLFADALLYKTWGAASLQVFFISTTMLYAVTWNTYLWNTVFKDVLWCMFIQHTSGDLLWDFHKLWMKCFYVITACFYLNKTNVPVLYIRVLTDLNKMQPNSSTEHSIF